MEGPDGVGMPDQPDKARTIDGEDCVVLGGKGGHGVNRIAKFSRIKIGLAGGMFPKAHRRRGRAFRPRKRGTKDDPNACSVCDAVVPAPALYQKR